MKKVLLFLFSIQLAIGSFATEKSIGSATIVTREQPGNVGLFEYTIEIKANEAFRLVDMPKINVPKGWKSYVMAFPQGRSCIKSTPTRFKVFVLYPANKRPFYPQQLSVSFSVQSLLDTARRSTLVAGGRVYFTPYNSVEIFSDQDFENSNRVWINEQSGVAVKRIYMPKNAIPVSNLNLATDTLGGRDMDDLEIKLVYMPGLAYCVPMKLTSDQMLVEDCDDGIDSIGTASQQMVDDLTNMLVNASNNPELATPLDLIYDRSAEQKIYHVYNCGTNQSE